MLDLVSDKNSQHSLRFPVVARPTSPRVDGGRRRSTRVITAITAATSGMRNHLAGIESGVSTFTGSPLNPGNLSARAAALMHCPTGALEMVTSSMVG